MKKKKIILTGAAVAAVVVIGIGAWTLFGRKSSDGSTENVVYVNSVDNLMNPGSGNGAVNRFAGVVETQKQVDIQQSQDKTVKDIYVEVGQEVSKGDPLFSYDTEKSQEDLEKAKLELERIDNNIGNKQNEIAALEKEKKSAGNDADVYKRQGISNPGSSLPLSLDGFVFFNFVISLFAFSMFSSIPCFSSFFISRSRFSRVISYVSRSSPTFTVSPSLTYIFFTFCESAR